MLRCLSIFSTTQQTASASAAWSGSPALACLQTPCSTGLEASTCFVAVLHGCSHEKHNSSSCHQQY